ncbi:hypothetical protein O181_080293 [Austropuccinia psidii MF-1]|uniref:Uncharacterized protein n=1 Tax=Austropuccinia psidii MF-1 TaxID=1389203 RepID=A0A9Q3IGE4_9BASI|nr:hypothetical protein [Austropuccinia psidii MF-1]
MTFDCPRPFLESSFHRSWGSGTSLAGLICFCLPPRNRLARQIGFSSRGISIKLDRYPSMPSSSRLQGPSAAEAIQVHPPSTGLLSLRQHPIRLDISDNSLRVDHAFLEAARAIARALEGHKNKPCLFLGSSMLKCHVLREFARHITWGPFTIIGRTPSILPLASVQETGDIILISPFIHPSRACRLGLAHPYSKQTMGSIIRPGLPFFAPRKPPQASRSLKSPDIPLPVSDLLSNVYTIIQNRPRKFQHAPSPRPKYWWRLKQHRQSVLWYLYRNLLRHSKQFDLNIKVEIQQSKKTNTQKVSKFAASFVLTNWIKSKFYLHRALRTIPHTQEVLRQAYLLLDQFLRAHSRSDPEALASLRERRDDLVQARRRETWAKLYQKTLDTKPPPKPIMTGRFLRPTYLNGPLPRLAHQPLHISMMISSRRKAHDRRMAQYRQLKEHLEIIEKEHQFEKQLGNGAGASAKEHAEEVSFIHDRLKVINQTFVRERERERGVYSRELLDKIEAARRRRPKVMEQRNRWKRIKTRLAEVDWATSDDDTEPETMEGRRFRIPEPHFWQN